MVQEVAVPTVGGRSTSKRTECIDGEVGRNRNALKPPKMFFEMY